ncbi:hypothetical protein Q9L58_002253 [Maublancomyces gigas]|uniref:Uncharacterized protein n=1 Tax=Discina gigas TaxID=1032678 RepID=A0ABR3GRW6_9PEZI
MREEDEGGGDVTMGEEEKEKEVEIEPVVQPETNSSPPEGAPQMTQYDITEDPLNFIIEAKAPVKELVMARAKRWKQARVKMQGPERDHYRLRKEREEWEGRWQRPTIEDFWELSEAEEHMIAFFGSRNLKEVDKRCWLAIEGIAGIKAGEPGRVRNGEAIDMVWMGMDEDGRWRSRRRWRQEKGGASAPVWRAYRKYGGSSKTRDG